MRVVLDTNVIISGWVFHGPERRVLECAERNEFELVVSEFILLETESAIARKFGWFRWQIEEAVNELRMIATIVDPPRSLSVVADNHPDNRILECAVDASADYLVTGDRKHLLPVGELEGVRIVRAPEFLRILERA